MRAFTSLSEQEILALVTGVAAEAPETRTLHPRRYPHTPVTDRRLAACRRRRA
jgi:hypothetical protein